MTEDVDVRFAVVVGPVLQRIVRIIAVALGFGALLVAVVGHVMQVQDGVPSLARFLGAALVLGCSLPLVLTPLDDPRTAVRNQGRVEAYPLVLAVLGAAFQTVFEPTANVSQFLLLVAVMGALYVRTWVLAVLVTVTLGAQLLGTATSPVPDWFTTAGYVVIAALAVLVARTAGNGYRRAVRQQILAQMRAEVHADELRTVAVAARELHVLDADALLASIVDAAGRLGWTEVGLWAPSGNRGTRPSLPAVPDPGPAAGLVDDVGRRGRTVAAEAAAAPEWATWTDGVPRTTVGAPVIVHGALRCALVVGRASEGVTAEQVHLVELLADQASRALEVVEDHGRDGRAPQHEQLDAAGFLATVSHELRTPLHVVLGFAETVHERWDDLDDGRRLDMIGRLRDNARGLQHVIESMLDYSRLEAGAVQAHRRSFDLVPVVQDVVRRLDGLALGHTVVMDVDGDGEVWGDPLLLERAIENLVSNALRHTPGGTTVRLRVRGEASSTRLVVEDDGPGLSVEDARRLGGRFFRGSNSGGTRGVGLGLAFTVEVLRQHGSELELRTAPGQGAAFGFVLEREPARARA